jgi:DNA replication initiation complex subunit (GINS family)
MKQFPLEVAAKSLTPYILSYISAICIITYNKILSSSIQSLNAKKFQTIILDEEKKLSIIIVYVLEKKKNHLCYPFTF